MGENISDGLWHTVIVNRQRRTGIMRMWIDGEFQANATGSTQALIGSEDMVIGQLQVGYNSFVGSLRRIRIYHEDLEPNDCKKYPDERERERMREQSLRLEMIRDKRAEQHDLAVVSALKVENYIDKLNQVDQREAVNKVYGAEAAHEVN